MMVSDPDDVLMQMARVEGYMRAVGLLAIRFKSFAEGADLLNINLADTPPFLVSPVLPLESHVSIRVLRETLIDAHRRRLGSLVG